MARFYFHLRDGDKLVQAPEGSDLPDVEAARREALLAARDILGDAIKAGKAKVPEAFVIADDAGRKLAVVSLVAVLPESLKKCGCSVGELPGIYPDSARRRHAQPALNVGHITKPNQLGAMFSWDHCRPSGHGALIADGK
jgi:hypothetical protein